MTGIISDLNLQGGNDKGFEPNEPGTSAPVTEFVTHLTDTFSPYRHHRNPCLAYHITYFPAPCKHRTPEKSANT